MLKKLPGFISVLKKKDWVKKLIKSKIILFFPVATLSLRVVALQTTRDKYLEKYIVCLDEKKEIEKQKQRIESQADGRRKLYDDINVSYLEKKKTNDIFINIANNDYYEFQVLSLFDAKGYDLLGNEDVEIQDTLSASSFKVEDALVAETGIREWSRQPVIRGKDTVWFGAFKFRRIEINKDTIVGTLVFKLDKLKRELKLKDYENKN